MTGDRGTRWSVTPPQRTANALHSRSISVASVAFPHDRPHNQAKGGPF